jgi:hypothetical protein
LGKGGVGFRYGNSYHYLTRRATLSVLPSKNIRTGNDTAFLPINKSTYSISTVQYCKFVYEKLRALFCPHFSD